MYCGDTIVYTGMECSCGPLIVVGGSDKDQQVSPMRECGEMLYVCHAGCGYEATIGRAAPV